jgi:hypothetical protein
MTEDEEWDVLNKLEDIAWDLWHKTKNDHYTYILGMTSKRANELITNELIANKEALIIEKKFTLRPLTKEETEFLNSSKNNETWRDRKPLL